MALANHGAEALALWGNGGFDLLLMDVPMPQMEGFEATPQIRTRQLGGGRHIPIVVMMGESVDCDSECCMASEMDDYISNSISSQSMAEAIFRLVLCAGVR